jgi:hypothetical protein
VPALVCVGADPPFLARNGSTYSTTVCIMDCMYFVQPVL